MKKNKEVNPNKRKIRFPIRAKTILMIFVLALVIIEVSVAYYSVVMNRVNKETYMKISDSISGSVAQVVNVDDVKYIKDEVKPRVDASSVHPIYGDSDEDVFNTYIEQFEYLQEDATFNKTRDFLRKLVQANIEYVDCMYLVYIDPVNELFVYLCDSAEIEDACAPGWLDMVFDFNRPIFEDPTRGFPAYITNTEEYGYLCTSGAPVYDGDTVVAYAMVDISMTKVRKEQATSIVRLFLYLLISVNLIGVIGIIWVSFWMIRPLKKLTQTAGSYDEKDPKTTHENFQKLEINTRDEIADLTSTIKKMENDVYSRFNDLLETNRQLISSREQTKKMTLLANQDGLTGVRNKVAYNSEVKRIEEDIKNGEEVKFAVVMVDLNYLKEINDSFGHDAGDISLIRLTSMICDTFALSAVYRVGGDEFVAICRGKDYKNIDRLVDIFKAKVKESTEIYKVLDPERISAAIGYSLFDPEKDKCVDDVFKRADKAMYQNKREMKKEEN